MTGLEGPAASILSKVALTTAKRYVATTEFDRLCDLLAKRFADVVPFGADDYRAWGQDEAFAVALQAYMTIPHVFDRPALVAAITPLVGPLDQDTPAAAFADAIAAAIADEVRLALQGDALLRLEIDRVLGAVRAHQDEQAARGLAAGDYDQLDLATVRPIGEVRWQEVGVRRPVSELAIDRDGQVPFVRRTVGAELAERLRAAAAAPAPAMIVLAGPSMAGKSRLAWETLRSTCPDALLVAPADARHARLWCSAEALARVPGREPIVVWLDDVEQFVDLPGDGLGAADFNALRDVDRAVILLCTRGGRGQQIVGGDAARLSRLDLFTDLAGSPILLGRRLDDQETAAASTALPGALVDELRNGLGSYAVAREQLQNRYVYAPATGACAWIGDAEEGRAFVDALLVMAAVTGERGLGDDLARAAWERFRSLHGRNQPAADGDWALAKDWATCEEVPGHPLVRWVADHERWVASDVIVFDRGHAAYEAHRRLTPVLERWAQDAPAGALRIAYRTHNPADDELAPGIEEAVERWYVRAIDEHPAGAIAVGGLARLYEQQGRIAQARETYERALELDDANPETWNNYAMFVAAQDDAATARAAYVAAVAHAPSASLLCNYGAFLDDHHEPLEAAAVLAAARELDPGHYPTLMNVARLAERVGDHAAALATYGGLIAIGHDDDETVSRYLVIAAEHGADAEAEARLEAIARAATAPTPVWRCVQHFLKHDAPERARDILHAVLETTQPGNALLSAELATTLSALGDADGAIAAATAAADADPVFRARLADLLDELGRPDEADALVDAMRVADPSDTRVTAKRARLLQRRDHGAEAKALLEEALAGQPDDRPLLAAYTEILLRTEGAAAALEPAGRLAAMYPPNPDEIGNHALFLYSVGETERAREVFARALASAPRHVNNLVNAARALAAEDDRDAARELLDTARAEQPEDLRVRVIGAWLDRADETAVGTFAEALAEDPARAIDETMLLTRRMSGDVAAAANALFDGPAGTFLRAAPNFAARAGQLRATGQMAELEFLYQLAMTNERR